MKEAVELTQTVIERLARNHRNLVVAVVILFAASLLGALFLWSWRPLLGLLGLVPLCGFMLALDTILLRGWQCRLLEMWQEEQLDLDGFVTTVSGMRMFPPQTLKGLLDMLPSQETLGQAPGGLRAPDRVAVGVQRAFELACEADRTWLAVLASAWVCGVLTWTLLEGDWVVLWGLALLPVAVGLRLPLTWWRRRSLSASR